MKEAGTWVSILRPQNAVIASAAVICGSVVEGSEYSNQFIAPVLLLSFSVFLITGGANILNDINDEKIDRIGHPERPIPSGRITIRFARSLLIACWISGIMLGAFASFLISASIPIIIILSSLLLIWLYERTLKDSGLMGNLTIGVLTGGTFILGSSAVGISSRIVPLFVMAFLSTVSREIIKDVEDLKMDEGERTTLPYRIGKGNSLILSSLIMFSAIVISGLPLLIWGFDLIYLIPILVADIIFVISIYISIGDASRSQNLIKLGMVCALIGFIFWSF